MPLLPRDTTPPEDMGTRMASLSTRAYAALAIGIALIGTQLVMALFMLKIWLNARHSPKPADAEQGLELGTVSRGCVPSKPQAPPAVSPVGPTMSSARGRPVAAYNVDDVHGEAEDYYHPRAPVSAGTRPGRQPMWTVDSGVGQQTYGADYTGQPRGNRFGADQPHRTNTNDADYGRRGNRFAHGT